METIFEVFIFLLLSYINVEACFTWKHKCMYIDVLKVGIRISSITST